MLLSFIRDCHSILDVFSAAGVDVVRAMPLLTCFRIPYAFKALAILHIRLNARENDTSKVIDQSTLNWQGYVKDVSNAMETASCNGLYPVPEAMLRIRDTVRCSLRAGGAASGYGHVPDAHASSRELNGSTLSVAYGSEEDSIDSTDSFAVDFTSTDLGMEFLDDSPWPYFPMNFGV